jgi:hypothetical protein
MHVVVIPPDDHVMEDFGDWLRTFLHDIPIRFVPAEEPYW